MKKLMTLALTTMLCAMCALPASALEYTVDAPQDYLFGRATSMEEIHTETEPINSDRSKNVALIPPGFGTPTSYLPGSGEYLTPNLVPGGPSRTGTLSGGLVTQLGEVNYPAVSAGTSYTQPGQTVAQFTAPTQTVTYHPI